jgi:hypothetical protein
MESEAARINKESLASLHQSVEYIQSSIDVGSRICSSLDEQREGLSAIERNMDKTFQDLLAAERTLQRMKRCCGCFVLPWQRSKALSQLKACKAAFDAAPHTAPQSSSSSSGPSATPDASLSARNLGIARSSTRTTGSIDLAPKLLVDSDVERENHALLSDVQVGVGHLRQIALSMGQELDRQNQVLERLHYKMHLEDRSVGLVTAATVRMASSI